jgi:predicted unusual protein kinase regulating ubiquinone biosynthesis (AarF/ABC1/UbiB family)
LVKPCGILYVPNPYLRKVHADPHPGNFLVSDKNELILDFGCMKIIPNEFYVPYFELIDPQVI